MLAIPLAWMPFPRHLPIPPFLLLSSMRYQGFSYAHITTLYAFLCFVLPLDMTGLGTS